MSGFLRIILIAGAIISFLYMVRKIRQSKVKIEDTIFWLLFSLVLIFMGAFPKVIYNISDLLGFQSPVNLVFLVIIFVLIVKLFFVTIQISQLSNKVDELAQKSAIDRKIDNEQMKKN